MDFLGPPSSSFYCYFGLSRINCFSSLHNSQGGAWRDDIRAGVGGTSAILSDRDGAKDTIKDGMDRENERTRTRRDMADATRDAASASSVGEVTNESTVKAMQTGLDVGEKAKQTLDIAWDAAEETAKNVKDAAASERDDKGGRLYENEPADSNAERD